MNWWPFVLRSTHVAELDLQRKDFARNLAERDKMQTALEDSVRYHRSRAEVLEHQVRAASCVTQESVLARLGVSAAIHAFRGTPICRIAVFRAEADHTTGSVVALIAGPMSDADMRRFRDFCGSFAQDVAPQERVRTFIDNLKPEDPS